MHYVNVKEGEGRELPACCSLYILHMHERSFHCCIFILAPRQRHLKDLPAPQFHLTVIVQKLTKIYTQTHTGSAKSKIKTKTKQKRGKNKRERKRRRRRRKGMARKVLHFLVLMYVNYRGIFHAEDLHFNLCTEKFAFCQSSQPGSSPAWPSHPGQSR